MNKKTNDLLKLIAKTSYGLEKIVEQELKAMGAERINAGNRVVEFHGDKRLMYRANMGLRAALSVLQPIKSFRVHNEDDLYHKAKKIRWDKYLDLDATYAISYTVSSKKFRHSQYTAFRLKDAINDSFREMTGKRPSVDVENPDLKIDLHINQKNECTISFDSSGDALFKRGYKTATHRAPLKEDLAAGMILLTGWDGKTDFIDPMCGSGTLLCEAYLIARNIPPNYHRNSFCFQKWKNFDEQLYREVRKEFESGFRKVEGLIKGTDDSGRSLRAARENLSNIGALEDVKTGKEDFFRSKAPSGSGMLIFNPPYGQRMNVEDTELFYEKIGDALKNNYPGYSAWILSSNKEALKNIGLKASEKIKLFNGKLACTFVKYEVFQGSLKEQKSQ